MGRIRAPRLGFARRRDRRPVRAQRLCHRRRRHRDARRHAALPSSRSAAGWRSTKWGWRPVSPGPRWMRSSAWPTRRRRSARSSCCASDPRLSWPWPRPKPAWGGPSLRVRDSERDVDSDLRRSSGQPARPGPGEAGVLPLLRGSCPCSRPGCHASGDHRQLSFVAARASGPGRAGGAATRHGRAERHRRGRTSPARPRSGQPLVLTLAFARSRIASLAAELRC